MDLAAFAPESIPWMGPGAAGEGSAHVGPPVLLPGAQFGEAFPPLATVPTWGCSCTSEMGPELLLTLLW